MTKNTDTSQEPARNDGTVGVRVFAAAVGLSPSAIRNELNAGRITYGKYGRKTLIPAEEIKRFKERILAGEFNRD